MQNKINDKLKDKLLKLYELAKRGVDGEKVNAEFLLRRMLEKHGLSIEDINQDMPKDRYYKFTNKMNEKMITQIMGKVINDSSIGIYRFKGYKEVTAKVTDYQHVQILELIDFHLDNFNKEKKQFLDDLTSAYVQKHKLFPESNEQDLKDEKPLTIEEKLAIMRMLNLQDNLSDKTYIKKLKS